MYFFFLFYSLFFGFSIINSFFTFLQYSFLLSCYSKFYSLTNSKYNYNTHMNSPILSFYLLTNRIEYEFEFILIEYEFEFILIEYELEFIFIEYELEFIFIEYELEFIFPHRNSTILSFHHIYYLLFTIYSRIFSNIPSYSLI